MRRTNIYLDERQDAALKERADREGVTRADLVRRLIDRGLEGAGSHDLEADVIAIRESSGVLAPDDLEIPVRGPDERTAHLDRLRRIK